MKDILIRNFRCYEEKMIALRPGINLLIGDNAAGKTSLVRACNLVANAFFCGYSDENTVWKSAEVDDFRNVVDDESLVMLPEDPICLSFHLGADDLLPILLPDGTSLAIPEDSLCIEKRSKKNSRNLLEGLKPLREYGARLLLYSHSEDALSGKIEQHNALPVYACFTTEDIHASRKFQPSRFKEYSQKPSFGYFECYDCRGLLDYWLNRLLVLQEAALGDVEIQTVRNAITKALGEKGCQIIDDMIVRPMRGKVFFRLMDGRLVEASLLSDGYKRLVNIVLDIAIRCALLNRVMYGVDSCEYTHGTVIIDEIDEHLHPMLQQRVLKALQHAFPRIQFIVTTHAPMVISSVESNPNNVVYRLWYDQKEKRYLHEEVLTYGLDANLIVEEKMQVGSRYEEIQQLVNRASDFLNSRQLDEAERIITELEQKTDPTQPTLVRLRSVWNRLKSRGL